MRFKLNTTITIVILASTLKHKFYLNSKCQFIPVLPHETIGYIQFTISIEPPQPGLDRHLLLYQPTLTQN